MSRIPEVLDCWFESGSMPFAQFHYPFENKKLFENNFPSQFVTEYIGQTRAWFYYMLSLSAVLFEDIPFENVLTTGTILAEDGSKMSKSKKNFPNPWLIFEKYGVDSLRFYLLSSPIMNAENFNFSEKGVDEIYKKVILLLNNVNNFYLIYNTKAKVSANSKNVLDKWIISRLNQTIDGVTKSMEDYNTIKTCSEIRNFIEDLSTWYLRRSRNRFNKDKNTEKTLRFVLNEFSKIIAPVMPFIAERIYQTVNSEKDSVHLQNWAKSDKKKIDVKLMANMKHVREIVSIGLKERDKAHIGLKWPLKSIRLNGNKKFYREFEEIIKEELNVKEVLLEQQIDHSLKSMWDGKITLDTNLTPDLEAEGYAREMSRQVQAFRKKLGLEKKDKIKIIIFTDDKFKKILEKQKDFLRQRTNAKKLKIVTTVKERFKNKTDFKIKDKKGTIAITK